MNILRHINNFFLRGRPGSLLTYDKVLAARAQYQEAQQNINMVQETMDRQEMRAAVDRAREDLLLTLSRMNPRYDGSVMIVCPKRWSHEVSCALRCTMQDTLKWPARSYYLSHVEYRWSKTMLIEIIF
jgi:hypothetical protein